MCDIVGLVREDPFLPPGVAGRIGAALRTEDIVGRWGEEEFQAVLPLTGLPGAVGPGERRRAGVAAEPIAAGGHATGLSGYFRDEVRAEAVTLYDAA